MIVMADSGLYSYTNFRMVIDAGADALFRIGANVEIPVLEWLSDGSYLSFIADSAEKAKNSYRLRHGLAKITDLPGIYVRAVDYEITGRGDYSFIVFRFVARGIQAVGNVGKFSTFPQAR
jgi:hypothetical protein